MTHDVPGFSHTALWLSILLNNDNMTYDLLFILGFIYQILECVLVYAQIST